MNIITWGKPLQTPRQGNFISVVSVLYINFNRTLLKIFFPEREEYQGEKYSWTRILDPQFRVIFTLKLETAGWSKNFLPIYQIIQCHIPENRNLVHEGFIIQYYDYLLRCVVNSFKSMPMFQITCFRHTTVKYRYVSTRPQDSGNSGWELKIVYSSESK
jgi:hypothetical protein